MDSSSRRDACPYAARHRLSECPAHHAVSFASDDSFGRPLPPALSCSFLTAGRAGPAVYYARCAIGDADARARYVELRRAALRARSHGALVSTPTEPERAGVLVADDDGRYVAVNDAICEMLAIPRQRLLEMSVWDLTPDPHAANGRAMWREFVAAGELFGRYELKGGDGRVRTFDFMALAHLAPGRHVSILTPVADSAASES